MAEGETGQDGSPWVRIAFAAEQRLILALVVAPRTQAGADELIGRTASVLVGRLPPFVSDGLDQYGVALFDRWHVGVPQPRAGRAKRYRTSNRPVRSHSYMRSAGHLCCVSVAAAQSREEVRGVWPMMPAFHPTPPENQAMRVARFPG